MGINETYTDWRVWAQQQVAGWCPTLRKIDVDTSGDRVWITADVGESGRVIRVEIAPDGKIIKARLDGIESGNVMAVEQYLLGAQDAISNLCLASAGLSEVYARYAKIRGAV
jgi:hypothetical protein